MKTLIIGHSSRMFWNQCHKKYYWSQIEQLEPKMPALALLRGAAGHKIVDYWRLHKEETEKLYQEAQLADTDLGYGLREYFAKYKDEPLVYKEGLRAFKVRIGVFNSSSYYGEPWEVFYTGENDGIVTDSSAPDPNDLWIIERKFTKQLPSDLVARFQLDDQIRGYCWAAHRLGWPVKGAIVDITRCTKNADCVRERVLLDETARDSFFSDLKETVQEIIEAREANRFPMSPHSCFTFGECPMRLLCLNPDQAYRADTMGYDRREQLHDEEIAARAT
jgi:hypothetical protein